MFRRDSTGITSLLRHVTLAPKALVAWHCPRSCVGPGISNDMPGYKIPETLPTITFTTILR